MSESPFFGYTRLSKYVQYIELRESVSDGDIKYPTQTIPITISFSAAHVVVDVRGTTHTADVSGFGRPFVIFTDELTLVGRVPSSAETFNAELLPSVLTVIYAEPPPTRHVIRVKSPLNVQLIGDQVILSVSNAADSEDPVPVNGLYTINGIRPDADGNFSITSKTAEVIVNVS